MDHPGAIPVGVIDRPSDVVAIHLQTMRESNRRIEKQIDDHAKEDAAFQKLTWQRIDKLNNLRWYSMGVIAALAIVAGVAMKWAPDLMRLAVQDVVKTQLREQAEADRSYLGSKLDSFKTTID